MCRLAATLACLTLSGCCWFGGSDAPLTEPATDDGLSGAESNLDHLMDKRDSRVAAAVVVAKGKSSEAEVKAELAVAEAMLPNPTPADLKFAKDRADRGDDAFYAQQVAVSRQLAAAIIEANKRYEAEKSRKQAEYDAGIAALKLQLAAADDAKWTWAGIGLVTIGLLAAFLTPLKVAGIGVGVAGFAVGSFPMLSKQPWFLPAVGGVLALGLVGSAVYLMRKRKPDETQEPKDS